MLRLLAALCLLSTAAVAQNYTITIPEPIKQNWQAVPSIMDQCMGAMTLRLDTTRCRELGNFLNSFNSMVQAAKPEEKPQEPPKDQDDQK